MAVSSPREIEAARYRILKNYLLFIGYQQSGHSILGALIDAHPDAIVGHELGVFDKIEKGIDRIDLFRSILLDAREHASTERRSYEYSYYIKDSWQGMHRFIYSIGDKQGGSTAAILAQKPHLLDKLRETVGLPLRVLHVQRNPYDNVASMMLRTSRPLDECACRYITAVRNVEKVRAMIPAEERMDIRQEMLIARPKETMERICNFLSLNPEPEYLELCAKNLFKEPNLKRKEIYWEAVPKIRIARLIEEVSFLKDYTFD